MEDCAKDPNVAGFKSVVCYRTGLDVSIIPNHPEVFTAMGDVLRHFRSKGKNEPFRWANKPLNDLVVCKTVKIAAWYSKPSIVLLFPPLPLIVPNTRSTNPRF